MRHLILIPAAILGALTISACAKKPNDTVERAFQEVNVVDENDLNDVMLTVADPNEAVDYFNRSLKQHPSRIDLQRGLALSLIRAKRNPEGLSAWKKVVGMSGSNSEDKVELADAQIRSGDWSSAEKTLDSIPPTYETFQTLSARGHGGRLE